MDTKLLKIALSVLLWAVLVSSSVRAQTVNWIQEVGAVTGSNPQIVARGSDTNVSLILTPQGTGGVGIGNTSPSFALDVSGLMRSTNALILGDNSVSNGIHLANDGSFTGLRIYSGKYGIGTMRAQFSNNGNIYLGISGGNFGIGTTSPQATLDINGYVRLAKYSSQPAACSATNDGAIALTHLYTLCVCNGGSTSWVRETDGVTACSW